MKTGVWRVLACLLACFAGVECISRGIPCIDFMRVLTEIWTCYRVERRGKIEWKMWGWRRCRRGWRGGGGGGSGCGGSVDGDSDV